MSNEGSADGSWAKLERAELHLKALNDEIGAFINSEPKPYRFVSKVDADTRHYALRIRILRNPPVTWSLVAGDCIQNMRAALDHLVCQLVIANGRKPTRGNAFPIFSREPSEGRAAKTWKNMVSGLGPRALSLIESCQPYVGGHGQDGHLLDALSGLSNEDKHRLLLPSFVAVGKPPEEQFDIDIIETRDVEGLEQGRLHTEYALKDGSLVLEGRVGTVTGPNPEVKLKASLSLKVGFGESPIVPFEAFVQLRDVLVQIVVLGERIIEGASTTGHA